MHTKSLTISALLLAILILCSQISVPLFGNFVPITLQTFAILMIGYLLPPRLAFTVTSLYLVAGLIGLPVFANYSGGFGSLASPAFGFIISFIIASTAMSYYLSKTNHHLIHQIIAAIFATAIIYFIGLSYLSYILNIVNSKNLSFIAILNIGMIPFLVGDILKAIVAILIAQRLKKLSLFNKL